MHDDPTSTDFLFRDHGSITTLLPLNDEARGWLEEHTNGDDVTWFGGALVIEPRYVGAIIDGIIADGLGVGA